MGKYDAIMNVEYPFALRHPRMPMQKRAAQFAPFAALSGYDDKIKESQRCTQARRILDESEMERLNNVLKSALSDACEVCVEFFVPDAFKPGGSYNKVRGRIIRYDPYRRKLFMNTGDIISIDCLADITRPSVF